MHVFVTGASGFVGSAVVGDLIAAGHRVSGLVRSEEGARAVEAAGATAVPGDIRDVDGLGRAAAAADAVIHTAFVHDFPKYRESCEIDRRAIEALGAALAGSSRPLVVTSGTGLMPPGTIGDETVPARAPSDAMPRASEQAAEALRAAGVDTRIVRLPPSVHGAGDHGFVPILIAIAREKGVSAYVGAGDNRWAAVHRFDAAPVFRLAIERGEAGGRYHAVADEGVPFREIAEVIGRRLGVPVESRDPAEAAAHFGWFAHFAAMGSRVTSDRTRSALGWQPSGPGLIADIDSEAYFAA